MNKKYFITWDNGEENHAGSKARNDIDFLLFQKEFIDIKMVRFLNNKGPLNKIKRVCRMINNWIGVIFKIEYKGSIVIQYPIERPQLIARYCMKLAKIIKKVSFISIIHDLDSLRWRPQSYKSEIKFLKTCDKIIVHNNKMKQYLIKQGINSSNIVILHIFDYLIDNDIAVTRKLKPVINIAGNLNKKKSGYIYKLHQLDDKLQFNLFGPNFTGENIPNVNYKGQFPPEKLPQIFEGGFGLIWDGSCIETCNGMPGKYLRYNNPHKLSLFMVSELPVIVWRESAAAEFVVEENVGITIDSLNNLSSVLEKITPENYNIMVQNTKRISKKLRNGQYTIDAIERLEL